MFKKDDKVTLRSDWKEIEAPHSWATPQLANNPADTEYTVGRSDTCSQPWIGLSWVDANGMTRRNVYDPAHFELYAEQTAEELIAENISLEEQAAALQAKIARKYEFVRLNTETISRNIPESVLKFRPYL